MGGDGEKNSDFRITVDFQEFHTTTMAAKGTGFQPGAEARRIKQQALRDKEARLVAITDSGRNDTMF